MDEKIVRHLRGEATRFEEKQLNRWRSATPENEAQYQRTREVWALLGEVREPHVPPPPPRDSLVLEGDRRRGRMERTGSRRWHPLAQWIGYAVAAAAVLVMVFPNIHPEGDLPSSAPLLSSTGSFASSHEVTTVSLSDGSVVRMAAGTRMELLPGTTERGVTLDGKAFFAVAEGDFPFVVRTGAGAVRVLGTRFEVVAQEGLLRVVVLEGEVKVEGEGGVAHLTGGQAAYLSDGSAPRVENLEDVFSLLNWPGGLLVFQETPFAEVAREVGRRFGREVRITDPRLNGRRITAWFSDESLEEVVSTVCFAAGAVCTVGESAVTAGR